MSAQETQIRATATSWGAWLGAGLVLGLVFCAIWWAVIANEFVSSEHVDDLEIGRAHV